MKLINTDGMAFIGPGSEWSAAVSGIVLAVTFLAIYRQLRMARSANAFAQSDALGRTWASERMVRFRLSVYLAVAGGSAPEAVPDSAARVIGDYWDNVGMLVRAGHIEMSIAFENLGYVCQLWWALLRPALSRTRASLNVPGAWEHFEWLAGVLAALDRKAGTLIVFDESYLAGVVEGRIRLNREMLLVEQSLRTVILASAETIPAAPPATGAMADG